MTPSTADWIAVAAPVLGAAVNFLCQISLIRLRHGRSLAQSVLEAFAAGAAVTAAGTAVAWLYETPLLLAEGVGLAASMFAAYSSAAFVLFALVNLGDTSLRVRLIGYLLEHPDGLCPAKLLEFHPDTDLIELRVRRMKEAGQVRVDDGRLYPRFSALSMVATGISILKWMLYGRRSGRTHGTR